MFAEGDLVIVSIALISLIVLAISLLMKVQKIPLILSYILVGFLIGPFFLNFISNTSIIMLIGNLGVILLLFFIGLSISLEDLINNWKVSVLGTIFQVLLTVGIIAILGVFLDWTLQTVLLIAFVLSMSSTVVILKILESRGEEKLRLSKKVLSVGIMQDIMVIPMLIILNIFSGQSVSIQTISTQIIGMILAGLVIVYLVINKNKISIPYIDFIKKDFEIQMAFVIAFCFGIAALSLLFGLSAGLGAFIAGLIISASRQTQFAYQSLNSFQIVFVALFFISVGMLINIDFVLDNLLLIVSLTLIAFVINILINFLVFFSLKEKVVNSLYASLLLSHIGEFSFVLAAFALAIGSITLEAYNLTISIIVLSLIITPIFISIFRIFVLKEPFFGFNKVEEKEE
ncbi:MAG: cation:proton antiporter [Nanoarchaeota archaeon]|nr:cation:proton antiporter [Nanoarchaeota archaeon]